MNLQYELNVFVDKFESTFDEFMFICLMCFMSCLSFRDFVDFESTFSRFLAVLDRFWLIFGAKCN